MTSFTIPKRPDPIRTTSRVYFVRTRGDNMPVGIFHVPDRAGGVDATETLYRFVKEARCGNPLECEYLEVRSGGFLLHPSDSDRWPTQSVCAATGQLMRTACPIGDWNLPEDSTMEVWTGIAAPRR